MQNKKSSQGNESQTLEYWLSNPYVRETAKPSKMSLCYR